MDYRPNTRLFNHTVGHKHSLRAIYMMGIFYEGLASF